MEKDAIMVIDNMDVTESPIKLVNDDDFFKKTTPFKVKDVFTKYLKLVNHPKFLCFEAIIPKILDFEWATVGNSIDCGVFVMRHMETWFGVTNEKWDSGFPLAHNEKKGCLKHLRKKYVVKLVCSKVNKHHDRIMAEAVGYDMVSKNGFH
ncbi:hypothetical protein Hdeb2414_s0010g00343621 [Helianthus debilis subsp. tardiflorus]